MKTFKVVTECTAVTEYIVMAETAEQAEEKFFDSEFKNERVTDYYDENIDTVTEVKL